MFRLWAKMWKQNHLIKDVVICDDSDINRTKKVFATIEKACIEFDLSRPIWLDVNIAEFKKHDKTRFRQDNFFDHIDVDFLEIEVIEEDE
jgi:hypothetical protein